jgi:hypothetical protein
MTITVPGLPAGATAAMLNVTAAAPDSGSYLTVWPAGVPKPHASNLNFRPGQNVPNLVQVALGAGDQVSISNAVGNVDVVVDLEGYVAPAGAGTGLYNPLPPARICDTRGAQAGVMANQCDSAGGGPGTLGTGSVLSVQVTGHGGVPSSGVSAVVLNVTVAGPDAGSYLTVWPTGVARPTASNLNWGPGTTIANRVTVPVGTGGKVNFYNANGQADVIVDVGGWFTDNSKSSATGSRYVPLSPNRICDTRAVSRSVNANQCNGNGTTMGTLGPNGTRDVQVTGQGGVPASGVSAVVANVTVAGPTAGSYLTVWPSDAARPVASDINWSPGENVPNMVVAKLGATGAIDVYNAVGAADVVIDVEGYYIS